MLSINQKMNIDQELLQKIAHLARLEMPESAEKEMKDSLESVLNWMSELDEIDTSNVKPLTKKQKEFLYGYFIDIGDKFKANQYID